MFVRDLLSNGSAPLGRSNSHQGVHVSPSEKPTLNRRQTPGRMVISLLAGRILWCEEGNQSFLRRIFKGMEHMNFTCQFPWCCGNPGYFFFFATFSSLSYLVAYCSCGLWSLVVWGNISVCGAPAELGSWLDSMTLEIFPSLNDPSEQWRLSWCWGPQINYFCFLGLSLDWVCPMDWLPGTDGLLWVCPWCAPAF